MNLKMILQRGDIAIISGRIVLTPKSGDQVAADKWLQRHHDSLLLEILTVTGQTAFRYVSYTTGCYTRHKAGGVSMQMVDVKTGEQLYCVFNADVRRARNTRHGKKGSMLPDGHFTPPKQGAFLGFWQRTGLAIPSRLSAFHDSMSKLELIIFSGRLSEPGKIDKSSLMPLEIEHEQLLKAAGLIDSADSAPTVRRQLADNMPTRNADKEMGQTHTQQWIQANVNTCPNDYGIRLKVTRLQGAPTTGLKGESVEEWLSEYSEA